MTLSAPKSVSVMALVGGDDRIVGAHDKAVSATLGWIEKNAIETRMRDPATGAMVRAGGREDGRGHLPRGWRRQAKALGFSAAMVRAHARKTERGLAGPDLFAGPGYAAGDAAAWAVGHLAERQSVFGHADLLAATLAREPGAVTVEAAERAIAALERGGTLHAARGLDHGKHWTTDAALARESETIALMRAGQGAENTVMRRWVAETKLHRGRLNEGQKEAVKTILASTDRVLGIQGYAGTGKTTMLKRLRALGESRGYRTVGLAPSASAAKTLANESVTPPLPAEPVI